MEIENLRDTPLDCGNETKQRQAFNEDELEFEWFLILVVHVINEDLYKQYRWQPRMWPEKHEIRIDEYVLKTWKTQVEPNWGNYNDYYSESNATLGTINSCLCGPDLYDDEVDFDIYDVWYDQIILPIRKLFLNQGYELHRDEPDEHWYSVYYYFK